MTYQSQWRSFSLQNLDISYENKTTKETSERSETTLAKYFKQTQIDFDYEQGMERK